MKRLFLAFTIGAIGIAAIPQRAEAQWYKPWKLFSKKPPPPVGGGAPAAGGLTAQQRADVEMLRSLARQRDVDCDSTVACAEERVELWREVQIADPADADAHLKYEAANAALVAVRDRDTHRLGSDEKAIEDLRKLRLDLQEAASRERWLMGGIGLAVLLAVVVLLWLATIAVRKHRAVKEQDVMVAATRKATLQVVDGIGRGRSASMAGEVFRIGATAGDHSTRNDLVLSDADARISRFHCNVARRDGEFFVTDTSTYGTTLNGGPLRRGEPKLIVSGDTVVLAESTAIVFTVQ